MSVFQGGVLCVVICINVIYARLANTAPVAEKEIRLPKGCVCPTADRSAEQSKSPSPTLQSSTIQSSTTQSSTIQSSTMQWSTTQFSTTTQSSSNTAESICTLICSKDTVVKRPDKNLKLDITGPLHPQTSPTSSQTSPTSLQTAPASNQAKVASLKNTSTSTPTSPTSLQTAPASNQAKVASLKNTSTSTQTTPTSLILHTTSTEQTSSLSPDLCKHSGLITIVTGCLAMAMIYMV